MDVPEFLIFAILSWLIIYIVILALCHFNTNTSLDSYSGVDFYLFIYFYSSCLSWQQEYNNLLIYLLFSNFCFCFCFLQATSWEHLFPLLSLPKVSSIFFHFQAFWGEFFLTQMTDIEKPTQARWRLKQWWLKLLKHPDPDSLLNTALFTHQRSSKEMSTNYFRINVMLCLIFWQQCAATIVNTNRDRQYKLHKTVWCLDSFTSYRKFAT